VLVKLAKQAVLAAGQLKIHFWCVMPCWLVKSYRLSKYHIAFIMRVKQTNKSTAWTGWSWKGRDLAFFGLSVTADWLTCRVPNGFNPLPVQFKSLLPGQEGWVFFSGHLNVHKYHYALVRLGQQPTFKSTTL
jgi:hypothetical protein